VVLEHQVEEKGSGLFGVQSDGEWTVKLRLIRDTSRQLILLKERTLSWVKIKDW
jgi:hypothetical protein